MCHCKVHYYSYLLTCQLVNAILTCIRTEFGMLGRQSCVTFLYPWAAFCRSCGSQYACAVLSACFILCWSFPDTLAGPCWQQYSCGHLYDLHYKIHIYICLNVYWTKDLVVKMNYSDYFQKIQMKWRLRNVNNILEEPDKGRCLPSLNTCPARVVQGVLLILFLYPCFFLFFGR